MENLTDGQFFGFLIIGSLLVGGCIECIIIHLYDRYKERKLKKHQEYNERLIRFVIKHHKDN